MEPHDDPVAARLARLEAEVARLSREVQLLSGHAPLRDRSQSAAPAVHPPPLPEARPKEAPRKNPGERFAALGSATMLARIGIALLLLGVVFLLKYSIDQGWIGPAVRVAAGAALGLALVVGGWLLRRRRDELALVLQGGGIAALYASLFAGFQLYGLFGYTLAFVLMAVVTALSFALAVAGRSAVLSVVAVLGGLGTPFLLNRDAGTLVGLMSYTAVVLAGGSAVFYRFGWRSLLGAMGVGGAFVLLGAALFAFPSDAPFAERVAFQVGTVLVWAVPTLLPTTRRSQSPHAATDGLLGLLAAATLWVGSGYAWDLSAGHRGLLGMALGLGYAAAAALQWGRHERAQAAAIAAALLWSAGWVAWTDNGWSLVGPALAGAALCGATRANAGVARAVGGLLLVATGLVAATYMADASVGAEPLRAPDVYALLATLLLLATGVWQARWGAMAAMLVYALGLQWLHFSLSDLPMGGAWTSVAWGIAGIVAVVVGVRRDVPAPRLTGVATVLLAVAKLLLFDLPQLSTLARTLLFLAAGAVLLAVSYFVPDLLRSTSTAADDSAPGSAP